MREIFTFYFLLNVSKSNKIHKTIIMYCCEFIKRIYFVICRFSFNLSKMMHCTWKNFVFNMFTRTGIRFFLVKMDGTINLIWQTFVATQKFSKRLYLFNLVLLCHILNREKFIIIISICSAYIFIFILYQKFLSIFSYLARK